MRKNYFRWCKIYLGVGAQYYINPNCNLPYQVISCVNGITAVGYNTIEGAENIIMTFPNNKAMFTLDHQWLGLPFADRVNLLCNSSWGSGEAHTGPVQLNPLIGDGYVLVLIASPDDEKWLSKFMSNK